MLTPLAIGLLVAMVFVFGSFIWAAYLLDKLEKRMDDMDHGREDV